MEAAPDGRWQHGPFRLGHGAAGDATFTMEEVGHDGFTYDPGLNNETSATLVVA